MNNITPAEDLTPYTQPATLLEDGKHKAVKVTFLASIPLDDSSILKAWRSTMILSQLGIVVDYQMDLEAVIEKHETPWYIASKIAHTMFDIDTTKTCFLLQLATKKEPYPRTSRALKNCLELYSLREYVLDADDVVVENAPGTAPVMWVLTEENMNMALATLGHIV